MQEWFLAAVCLLFAFASVLLLRAYRGQTLSPRMLGVLLVGLFGAFPIVLVASGLVGQRIGMDKLILASSSLGIGAAIGTWVALGWLGPRGRGRSA